MGIHVPYPMRMSYSFVHLDKWFLYNKGADVVEGAVMKEEVPILISHNVVAEVTEGHQIIGLRLRNRMK